MPEGTRLRCHNSAIVFFVALWQTVRQTNLVIIVDPTELVRVMHIGYLPVPPPCNTIHNINLMLPM
jgi:hypothetical protein